MKIGFDLMDPKGTRDHTLRITAKKCIPALYLSLIPVILCDVLLRWQKAHIYFTLYAIEHIFKMA